MSIHDLVDELESAARSALAQAGAIKVCPFHSDVTIRLGKADAERHAYAIATNTLKSEDTMWLREDLMPAIKGRARRGRRWRVPAVRTSEG